MTKSKDPTEYKTSDLYFAAYLQTSGVPLKRLDKNDEGNKIFFIFDKSISSIEELQQAWYNNIAKVTANLFAHNIKNLKSACHTAMGNRAPR
jgi:hypothetical protein